MDFKGLLNTLMAFIITTGIILGITVMTHDTALQLQGKPTSDLTDFPYHVAASAIMTLVLYLFDFVSNQFKKLKAKFSKKTQENA